MKISTFIIALILISLTVAVFGTFWANVNTYYPSTSYDNTSLESMNKLETLRNLTEDSKSQSENIAGQSGENIDVIGSFFSSGYKALKITGASFDIFNSMTDEAVEKTGIEGIGIFKTALVLIVVVLIFIAIFVGIVVKWEI